VADSSQNREICAGSGSATSICCNGTCWDGCCDADGEPASCLAFFTGNPQLTGNLGGLDGADAICQARANANARPGTYAAWLSIGSGVDESPATGRFRHAGQPYMRVDGVTIAEDWADLISGTLDAPLNVTETGTTLSGNTLILTNTLPEGMVGGSIPGADCQDWTTSMLGDANVGNSAHSDSNWSVNGSGLCNVPIGRLYCFQQT